MESIVAYTRENAYAMGLEGELGTIEAGKLADLLILDADPLADIRILQRGKHLDTVIKDGRRVNLNAGGEEALLDLC
jgi:imidazolonepropionase-like amidohydrolase